MSWRPDSQTILQSNLFALMREKGFSDFHEMHRWSAQCYSEFWDWVIRRLPIVLRTPYREVADLRQGVEHVQWLPGATLNIVESCFTAKQDQVAICYGNELGHSQQLTFGELRRLVNRIVFSLQKIGVTPGTKVAIDMAMNIEAVATYLALIQCGAVMVAIADSFAPSEISTRLELSQTQWIFTQDFLLRAGKRLGLYEKVCAANAPRAIVLSLDREHRVLLREGDQHWDDFLCDQESEFVHIAQPHDHTTLLFSSGTTGAPKAIPWNHSTAIKCASDAFFHQNVKPGDCLCWPTNLGWMMGPWLLFAAFINRSSIALFDGAPFERAFGEFVAREKITMLGVIPSLVAHWRHHAAMENLDWSAIKAFSSSGECSNPSDMQYLMNLAGNKPVIEYCGGTEIGGAYISSTVIEENHPSCFTTPTLGLNFEILDDSSEQSDVGEIALIPPSIGLSQELIGRDHHQEYFAGMPKRDGYVLRRHGDEIERIAPNLFRALGRVDDTMNLGGIKTSSAAIERVLSTLDLISECAAIAVPPPQGGPSLLVICCVLRESIAKETLLNLLQQRIREQLNPLFKISDVVLLERLPRTASNKIMRRVLRENYVKSNR